MSKGAIVRGHYTKNNEDPIPVILVIYDKREFRNMLISKLGELTGETINKNKVVIRNFPKSERIAPGVPEKMKTLVYYKNGDQHVLKLTTKASGK